MAEDKRSGLLPQTFREFSDDECPTMAAAVAYYAVFSLPPLLVIVVTVAGLVWGPEAVRGRIEDEIGRMIGEGGQQQIRTMIEEASRPERGAVATLIGAAVLIVGATGVMAQLQYALNKIWDVEPDPGQGGLRQFLLKRVVSFAMILVLGFLLLVSMVLTATVGALGDEIRQWLPGEISGMVLLIANQAVSLLVFMALFGALFKYLPDVSVRWRTVWPGAAATALLFMLGQFLLAFYLGRMDPGAYGFAGSLVLILVWIYYSTMILFVGAELTQVRARRRGEAIEPAKGAVRVLVQKERIRSSAA